jgi:hypothetical protein
VRREYVQGSVLARSPLLLVFILKFEKGGPTLAPKTGGPLDAMSMLVFLGALVGA